MADTRTSLCLNCFYRVLDEVLQKLVQLIQEEECVSDNGEKDIILKQNFSEDILKGAKISRSLQVKTIFE